MMPSDKLMLLEMLLLARQSPDYVLELASDYGWSPEKVTPTE